MAQTQDGGIESVAEDVQDVLDTGLTIGRETPQVCAPDHDRSCTEREGLGDVASAPDPSVQKHLDLIADHVDDGGQQPDRSGSRIEVVAAVVRHRQGVDAEVDGAARVIDATDALQHERAAPLIAKPGDVFPGRRWGLHPLVVGLEERRRLPAWGGVRFGAVRSGIRPVFAKLHSHCG